ncbi:hypothetical protein MHTCC0001_00040 [Flavobacteriaceae bacterium MHTCC 0001]
MKAKSILIIVAVLCSYLAKAQTPVKETETENFHEAKINSLFLILGAFEVSYERTLNEESAFGIDVFLPFDDDIKDDINYYISPYYRLYISNNYASGFFIEGFGMLNSTKNLIIDTSDVIGTNLNEDNITDFALGVAIGGKWLTKSGFIGELNLGIGRNLFNEENDRLDSELVGKAGIKVGYRF